MLGAVVSERGKDQPNNTFTGGQDPGEQHRMNNGAVGWCAS
jgi:hypothetical protein